MSLAPPCSTPPATRPARAAAPTRKDNLRDILADLADRVVRIAHLREPGLTPDRQVYVGQIDHEDAPLRDRDARIAHRLDTLRQAQSESGQPGDPLPPPPLPVSATTPVFPEAPVRPGFHARLSEEDARSDISALMARFVHILRDVPALDHDTIDLRIDVFQGPASTPPKVRLALLGFMLSSHPQSLDEAAAHLEARLDRLETIPARPGPWRIFQIDECARIVARMPEDALFIYAVVADRGLLDAPLSTHVTTRNLDLPSIQEVHNADALWTRMRTLYSPEP